MPVYVHETSFRVRYAETDQMGIVHHTAYIVWFEEGRSDFLRAYNMPYSRMEREGIVLPVTECYARYVAPARYDEVVTVRTWIQEFKSRKIVFAYEVIGEDGRLCAEGYTAHICIDPEGRVQRFPKTLREAAQHPPHEVNQHERA
ncbi:MAG: acyl-CoA thioesterase [Ardenticatenia bacterium]|nr:MAG: acyl-CoA thioesterase [Ardenticatenia bacterium]